MQPANSATFLPTRLACLATLACAVALTGCNDHDSTVATPPPHLGAAAPSALPVTVSNQSSHTAYVLITGDPSQAFTVSPTTATIAAGGTATFSVTNISAGRIYVSYDTALSSNAPDGANPNDADYHTRFDKVELTYNQGSGGSANLTAVDFYAIPMMLQTSIQGTVINQLTLAPGQTGSGLRAALAGAVAAAQGSPVVYTNANTFARTLSPVKAPASYGKFDDFLATLGSATFTIAGTYFGSTSQAYSYKGAVFLPTHITLTSAGGNHVLKVPLSSLQYNATNLIDDNGIYTCNAAYTVDGVAHHVADNDIYAAVYRDLVAGFNLGFVAAGPNNSASWWTSPAFPPNSAYSGTYYNAYAKAVAGNYPGAYGFPFSDRYRQVLADLGGKVDALTITVLGDDTQAPPYTPQGNVNPQSGPGSPTFNMSLTTTDNNFNLTTFTFDTQTYQGGNNYNFPTTPTTFPAPSNSAVINNIPTQDGLNIYTLELRGRKYSVLANVSGGVIAWASIAGGGNATWTPPVLYVGGLN